MTLSVCLSPHLSLALSFFLSFSLSLSLIMNTLMHAIDFKNTDARASRSVCIKKNTGKKIQKNTDAEPLALCALKKQKQTNEGCVFKHILHTHHMHMHICAFSYLFTVCVFSHLFTYRICNVERAIHRRNSYAFFFWFFFSDASQRPHTYQSLFKYMCTRC